MVGNFVNFFHGLTMVGNFVNLDSFFQLHCVAQSKEKRGNKISVKVKFENSRHENLFSRNFSFSLKRFSSKILYSGKLVHFQLDIHLLILSYEKIGNPIFCIQWHLLHYCLKEMITIINS